MEIEIALIIISMLLVLAVLDFPDFSNFCETIKTAKEIAMRNLLAFFTNFSLLQRGICTRTSTCIILGINTPLAWLMTYHLNSITAKKKVNLRFYNRCSVNTHSQVQVTWIKSWLLKISKYFWETGQRNICMMTWTYEVDMIAVHVKLNYWMISNQDWK